MRLFGPRHAVIEGVSYPLGEKLGSGDVGTVYKVGDQPLIAKRITTHDPDLIDDVNISMEVRRAVGEALDGILPRVINAEPVQRGDFVISDYVDGERIRPNTVGIYNSAERVRNVVMILRKTMEKLIILGEHNLVHGDLKLDNILLHRNQIHGLVTDVSLIDIDLLTDISSGNGKSCYRNLGQKADVYILCGSMRALFLVEHIIMARAKSPVAKELFDREIEKYPECVRYMWNEFVVFVESMEYADPQAIPSPRGVLELLDEMESR